MLMCCFIMALFPPTFLMSPNVYLCIVSSIRIAYCFVRIAIRIISVFFRIDPALTFENIGGHLNSFKMLKGDKMYQSVS